MRKFKRKARTFLEVVVIALFILSLLRFNVELGDLHAIINAQQTQLQQLQHDSARLYQSTALSIEQIAELAKAVNALEMAEPVQQITRIVVPEAATEAPTIVKEPLNTKDLVNNGNVATVAITGTLSLLGKAISTLIPALP